MFDGVKKFFKKRMGMTPAMQTELKQAGVRVVQDGRLEDRIQLLEILHSYVRETIPDYRTRVEDGKVVYELDENKHFIPLAVTEKVERLYEKLQNIDSILRQISIPYGRGGDKFYYGQAMKGWEKLYAIGSEYVKTVGRRISEDSAGYAASSLVSAVDKNVLFQKLDGFLNMEVVRFGLWIIDRSWYDVDVTPQMVLAIQQMPTMPGYGPTTQQNPGTLQTGGFGPPPPPQQY